MNAAMNFKSRRAVLGVTALSLVALAGCSRVKPEELTAELAKLRQEMRTEYEQGDQKVATDLGARVDGLDARMGTLADELDRLSESFDVTVERLEGAIRFSAPVYFTFDDATVRESDREVLDRFAGVVKSYYPDGLITAEGFTDPSGSTDYNRKLGMRRAESVVAYLTSQGGLDTERLRAVSYGEESQRLMDEKRGPGETGLTNRRVVLVIEGSEATTPLPNETN